ncbi:hypothetical protein C8N46_103333 [Kordia periserrulae]|uniref:DinB family protein n=1 Tax=Kordia periserrulae TaxID=701523 RepID=A0A2T6C1P7_9FLAO|nr:hypothetical protein [Kordia periserrulae]PTX62233.1 hypothetical protein C8N46_103333 [Kordia periserrulae]
MKKVVMLILTLHFVSCAPKKITLGMGTEFLHNELKEIENYIQDFKSVNSNVSKVSVGWHLEHLLLTITKIYEKMEKSNPKEYRNRFNFTKMMIFSSNQIPRGKATAPTIVTPSETIELVSINKKIILAKQLASKIDNLPENTFFKHPSAGYLNRDDAKRFLKIHTEHHLKIIRDILHEPSSNKTN